MKSSLLLWRRTKRPHLAVFSSYFSSTNKAKDVVSFVDRPSVLNKSALNMGCPPLTLIDDWLQASPLLFTRNNKLHIDHYVLYLPYWWRYGRILTSWESKGANRLSPLGTGNNNDEDIEDEKTTTASKENVIVESNEPGVFLSSPIDFTAWFSPAWIASPCFSPSPSLPTPLQSPVILELGSGYGQWLLEQARLHPQARWIGCEVVPARGLSILRRIRQFSLDKTLSSSGSSTPSLPSQTALHSIAPGEGKPCSLLNHSNVKLLIGDAALHLDKHFADHSLDMSFLNFPEPHPKARHAKRRLLSPAFAALLLSKMKRGGSLKIATDHIELCNFMTDSLLSLSSLHSSSSCQPPASSASDPASPTSAKPTTSSTAAVSSSYWAPVYPASQHYRVNALPIEHYPSHRQEKRGEEREGGGGYARQWVEQGRSFYFTEWIAVHPDNNTPPASPVL